MDNADFLWRFAKATHLYGIVLQNRNEMEKRKQLAFEGIKIHVSNLCFLFLSSFNMAVSHKL